MSILGVFVPFWILIPLVFLILTIISNILTLLLAPIIGATIIFKIIKFIFKLLKVLFPFILVTAIAFAIFTAIF